MSALNPNVPDRNDIGRHSVNTPLMAGWPCRWCRRPLGRIFNNISLAQANEVGCANCDNGKGITP